MRMTRPAMCLTALTFPRLRCHLLPSFPFRRLGGATQTLTPPCSYHYPLKGISVSRRMLSSASSLISDNGPDFDQMRSAFEEHERKRDAIHAPLRYIRQMASFTLYELQEGRGQEVAFLLADLFPKVDDVIGTIGSAPGLREDRVSDVLELLVRVRAFQHFLTGGTLLPPHDPSLSGRVTDDEYLGGVCMVSSDLTRWAIKRATAMDIATVGRTRDVLEALLGKLLVFDFRNGPLRKKYDGVKWALRQTEDLLYELSVVGASVPERCKDPEAQAALVDMAGLDAICQRMKTYDEAREVVIKTCRDMQKAAKNAIFSLHREDLDRAQKLLDEAKATATTLAPTLTAHPPLRLSGSYVDAMEEYAEAVLFKVWLTEGRLAKKEEVDLVNTTEYVAGVMDLTGEIGRYAVMAATKRDVSAVQRCLDMDSFVGREIERTSLPPKANKKRGEFQRNQSKLETLLYQLSLTKAGKGRAVGLGSSDDQQGDFMMDKDGGKGESR